MMSIYKVFAQNLRAECKHYSSIAEVCRKSGINRQQFNKYLAGQALPNANTLHKLCMFLKIEDIQLFEDRSARGLNSNNHRLASPSATGAAQASFGLFEYLANNFDLSMGTSELIKDSSQLDGYYCIYFPLMESKDHLVNSLLRIKTRDGITYFTRHTLLRSVDNPKRLIAAGKHSGVVMTNQKEYYLLGLNRTETNQLSFLVFGRSAIAGSRIHLGLGMIYGFVTPVACRVCIEPIGLSIGQAKRHISRLGILPITDKAIHPIVVSTINRPGESFGLLLNNIVVDNLLHLGLKLAE